jgi:hypothetical protein
VKLFLAIAELLWVITITMFMSKTIRTEQANEKTIDALVERQNEIIEQLGLRFSGNKE